MIAKVLTLPHLASLSASLLGLAAIGCAPSRNPCEGLVYKDSGLSRSEYAGCANAMAASLDRMHEALTIVGDATRPKAERLRARQACFRAGSALAGQIRQAGGPEKLMRIQWADEELSNFNRDIDTARTVYAMYCYYGLTGPDVVKIDSSHEAARAFAATLP